MCLHCTIQSQWDKNYSLPYVLARVSTPDPDSIQIYIGQWIRIRNMAPDPGRPKWSQKQRKNELRNVIFWRALWWAGGFPKAWTSMTRFKKKYISFDDQELFSPANFFLSYHTAWVPNRIKILDPGADLTEFLDLKNLDPKQWFSVSDYFRCLNRCYMALKVKTGLPQSR